MAHFETTTKKKKIVEIENFENLEICSQFRLMQKICITVWKDYLQSNLYHSIQKIPFILAEFIIYQVAFFWITTYLSNKLVCDIHCAK